MVNNGKRYNAEFKADIVRLINEENRTVSSIVRDFGVSEQTVRNWLKESKDRQDPYKTRIAELDAYFGDIRTLIPELSGQHIGIIRTPCRANKLSATLKV